MLKGVDLSFEKLLARGSRTAVSESAQIVHLLLEQRWVPQPDLGGSSETIGTPPAGDAPGFTVPGYLLIKLLGKGSQIRYFFFVYKFL